MAGQMDVMAGQMDAMARIITQMDTTVVQQQQKLGEVLGKLEAIEFKLANARSATTAVDKEMQLMKDEVRKMLLQLGKQKQDGQAEAEQKLPWWQEDGHADSAAEQKMLGKQKQDGPEAAGQAEDQRAAGQAVKQAGVGCN